MIIRRGVPFPVQSDTEKRTEINPIERVEGTQGLPQEKTFDYERALQPEITKYPNVVDPDILINPQPKVTPTVGNVATQGSIAEYPIVSALQRMQVKMIKLYPPVRYPPLIHRSDESIASHSLSFGIAHRKIETADKSWHRQDNKWDEKKQDKDILTKLFEWINSLFEPKSPVEEIKEANKPVTAAPYVSYPPGYKGR